ncbi:hypothetical protein DL96DRAFT_1828795 [Flagelloscypha sp. PMI_526]|nr:hypothetical protein DL96DRAFT_1828795 [Flagelloscypha sp. PMI_526]
MATLLSSDLWHEILDYLPKSALNASTLINSSFRDIAQPKVFSHIIISYHSDPTWRVKSRWFLYQARGRALCQEIKRITLFPLELTELNDTESQELVDFFQLLSPALHTLEFCERGRPAKPIRPTLMDGLRLFVFPRIRQLVVDDSWIPFFDILSYCTALKTLEFLSWNVPAMGNVETILPAIQRLERLIVSAPGGSLPPQSASLEAYLYSQADTIKYLRLELVGTTTAISSFDLLKSFKALVEISFTIELYNRQVEPEWYSNHAPDHASVPLHELPCLRLLAFQIGLPRLDSWSRFLPWISRHLSSRYPSSPPLDIHFSFEHNAAASSCYINKSLARMNVISEFNNLAPSSAIHFRFVIQTRLNTLTHVTNSAQQEYDYNWTAELIKRWFSLWIQAGKLEIWREWSNTG